MQLRSRLEQDIAFSHHHLKADFQGFMTHALEVSEAFEKVDSGPSRSRKFDKESEKTKSCNSGSGSSSSRAGLKNEAHPKGT